MKPFDLSIALFSFSVIVLGLFYKKLKRSPFNETLLAMLIGILFSPSILDVIRVAEWGRVDEIMEKACRLTLAMALMGTALRIPQSYLPTHKKVQATLLLPVLTAMFLSSAILLHWVAGFNWLLSLLLGAIVTPTDPVLAGTIVDGEKARELLPAPVRHAIAFESGANDGLAFPFVMLCLLLIQKPEGAWQAWLTNVVLWQTAGAIALGLLLGYVAGRALDWCINKNFTGKPAVLAFSLSVGFFVLTALELVGVNGILAVLMAGLMLKRNLPQKEDVEEEEIQEMMSRLFTIPIFVLFGLILPWEQWLALGWKAPVIAGLVLFFRRLPFLLLAKPLLPGLKTRDLLFAGWFGPMGAAALYYSFYSSQILNFEEIWTVTSLVVFSSVVVHGSTAYPFLIWYSRQTKAGEGRGERKA